MVDGLEDRVVVLEARVRAAEGRLDKFIDKTHATRIAMDAIKKSIMDAAAPAPAPKTKRKGWINIYNPHVDSGEDRYVGVQVWKTFEEARSNRQPYTISCIEIEWEE